MDENLFLILLDAADRATQRPLRDPGLTPAADGCTSARKHTDEHEDEEDEDYNSEYNWNHLCTRPFAD